MILQSLPRPDRLPAAETIAVWAERYPLAATAVSLVLLVVVAVLALYLVRWWLIRILDRVARHTSTTWDEMLLDRKVLQRLSWAVPALVVRQGLPLVPGLPEPVELLLQRLAGAFLVLVALRTFSAVLGVVSDVYARYPLAKERPIKGYLQVVKVVAYGMGGIVFVATLMDESPWIFFSGIGAMTAILLLVFRDTLLSLVAGVQLTANGLIRVGDWIQMPQFEADGDVVDIALNSVSVQNWDKTISVIPTHMFLQHSFRNWRGMTESGGRRIKRAFHVDMTTVRFLDADEVERFRRFVLLREYVEGKVAELEAHNRALAVEPPYVANARRLTNLGMLRAYLVAYLRQHPLVHGEMTMLVRQLAPTPEGLPMEIYVFTSDTRWAAYEAIQSDIFDHVLAMLPEFGLRVFQRPAGSDLARLRFPEVPVEGGGGDGRREGAARAE